MVPPSETEQSGICQAFVPRMDSDEKKLLILILCLGLTFAFGACDLFNDTTSSNSQTESSESIDNSGDNSSDNSGDNSGDSSGDNSGDSSADAPIIDGENEMPLVPIG